MLILLLRCVDYWLISEDPRYACISHIMDASAIMNLERIVRRLHSWIDGGMLSATTADFPQYKARIIWASFSKYLLSSIFILACVRFWVLAYLSCKPRKKEWRQQQRQQEDLEEDSGSTKA